ncbi:DUF4097 family beta strand repeat-containing protein [uncultured Psychrobacillus sp.]|uniref:DUF4097 family beta strand repeat-containing protein n=1 Tax=uncultured Psychrobacillus sp. TaxID=1551585 RepID=UPI002633A4AB|nr:DUF4097 family beta strand repeat-containing protein [uncultured Psychrobacillus sp.]
MNLKRIVYVCITILLVGIVINIAFNVRGFYQVDAAKVTTITEQFDHVEVTSDNASISVLPSSSSDASVEYTSKQNRKNLSVKVKDNTLLVELKQKWWNNFRFVINTSSNKLIIYLPEKEYEEIMVSTSNGSVEGNEIKANQLIFESDNGSVELEDIIGKDVYAETNNGKVFMKNVEGKIEADSDNGSITLETKTLDQYISLSTDNGSIEVNSDQEPTNATITASNDFGGINIYGSSDKTITYGKGKYQIELDTDLGSISVK